RALRPLLLHRDVLHVLRPEHARRRPRPQPLSLRGPRPARARVQLRAVRPAERYGDPDRDRRRRLRALTRLRLAAAALVPDGRVRRGALRRLVGGALPRAGDLSRGASPPALRSERSRSVLARPRDADRRLGGVARVPPAPDLDPARDRTRARDRDPVPLRLHLPSTRELVERASDHAVGDRAP